MNDSIHVIHASFNRDRLARSPETLIQAWPTLTDVAAAVAAPGVGVSVVIPHAQTTRIDYNQVRLYFTPHVIDVVRSLQPQIVHLHGFAYPVAIRAACAALDAPFLIQDHGGVPRRWRHPWIKWGLHRIQGAAFTAREQAIPYRHLLPKGVEIFEILEGSTDFRAGDRMAAQKATGVSGDPAVLWVGRLDRNKDPLTALEAVRRAAMHLPGLRLYCCYGSADLIREVEQMIAADPDLAMRVTLLGRVPHQHVQRLCRAADFFLSCSHREGSGYALIEALACGATPVATSIPPFRAITGGKVGKLARPGDVQGFADALIELAQQPRSRLRETAVRHFRTNLTFDVIGEQLRQAYSTLLARDRRHLHQVLASSPEHLSPLPTTRVKLDD